MLQQPSAASMAAATGGASASAHPQPARGATSGGGGVMVTPRGSLVQRPKRRFGEPLKLLPVIFVACTIFILYITYVSCHCFPRLQLSVPHELVNQKAQTEAIYELVAFHIITPMLLICYVRSVLVHPGEIPDDDPHWEYKARDMRTGTDAAPMGLQETKKSGERRHCKWCGKFKPDRCHHCRVCKTCILKMDHHCPWIYNCVGFRNYKCFFLLLFYSVLDCHLIFWTMQTTVLKAVHYQPSFMRLFMLFFGQALTFFIGTLVTLFFCFHIWLMLKAMTTIEFCEKSLPKKEGEISKNYDSSLYDLGIHGNIRAVLGDNPLLWLFPFSFAPPAGDGLNFMSDETRLTVDMEIGKGMRRRGHRASQRPPRLLLGGEIYDEYADYGLYPSGAYGVTDESMLYGEQGYAGAVAAGYGSTAQLQPQGVPQYYDPTGTGV